MKKISRKRLTDLKFCVDYALQWVDRLVILSRQPPSVQQSKNIQYCVHRIQMHVEAAVRNILAILK